MFIQGYGIGFPKDPRVEAHLDPNTRSSVNVCAQLNPSGSFKLPLLGGKLTEMIYLWTRRHDGRQELRYSPPLHFLAPHTQYCIFENFWVKKNFFCSFWTLLNWTRILNINTIKWKTYFFRYTLHNILNFWKFLGQKNFFWVILVFNELSSNF